MIGIIDSKICNIYSLSNMLKKLNADFKIINDSSDIVKMDKLILPGVGAFPKAIENLKKFNFLDKIIDFANSGKYLFGICLGMQLLFEESNEFGITKGLGLIPGKIDKIKTDLVLPHMGWNDLIITNKIKILENVNDNSDVYFVHSYKVITDKKYIAAYTVYDENIPAFVFNKNIFGAQFHPEKSKKWGEIILKNFINI